MVAFCGRIQQRAIGGPLTSATAQDHEYFFDAARVDAVISPAGNSIW